MKKLSLKDVLLPGVPEDRIAGIYGAGKGDEIRSGKFTNPESSACLAANAFGWFLGKGRPTVPLFPGLESCGVPVKPPVLEAELRFPWRGGRRPVVDALITTDSHLIGVESKRYEPFRTKGDPKISEAYSRTGTWSDSMKGYEEIHKALKNRTSKFERLDATQLFKHALGLHTCIHRGEGLKDKKAILLYLFAEPEAWVTSDKSLEPALKEVHRKEIAQFAKAVEGNEVRFVALSYGDLLTAWAASKDPAIASHAENLRQHFKL